jgi:serine protease Do
MHEVYATGAGRILGALTRTVAVAALAFTLIQPSAAAQARSAPESFADLAEKLLPAVVNIATTQTIKQADQRGGDQRSDRNRRGPDVPQFPPGSPFEDFFKDFFDRQQRDNPQQPRRATSLGSGFIIDAAGLIVTNNHVIADADEVTVRLHDDIDFKATIVGRDTKTDLALLKIEPGNRKLTAVPWGDSSKARVGDWVIAIGNPFGLGGTVTAGIVSARARDIQAGPYDDFIQTDASINQGNSGGPLFNTDGQVIGINTAIYSRTGGSVGIGFAVPATLAKSVIQQLKDYGRTRRGWLGVRIQQVTDEIAESLGLPGGARGALVADVTKGGPAEKSKIKGGDVILSFDGKPVPDVRRLPRIVADTPIEKDVVVTLWREGKEISVKSKLGELEEAEKTSLAPSTERGGKGGDRPGRVDALGMALSAVTPELRERFDLGENVEGVVVTDVDANGSASEKGIRPGDIIVEVGQEEVKTPADIAAKVKKAQDAKRKSVLLLVERQGEMRFVALRIGG